VPIREATVADARAIAEVHVEGWAWGYRGLLPDAVIDGLDVDTREQGWIEGFTERWRDGDGCLLWEDEGRRALGFVAFGPAADEHAPPPPGAGEVYSLYLRTAAAGTGVGRDLLGAAEHRLRAHGFDAAVLWVLEANRRARRFYEIAGWRPDGARAEHRFDTVRAPILRYARSLPTVGRTGVEVPPGG
jgi:ribosomal protein S18 acetylase RimI-like enzyme